MLEKAIEYWLTNTNERDYQIPFCQVLQHKGHKILYISSHRSTELGKDIVTLDPNGLCCAYQLKGGDINIAKWRLIQEQIRELTEYTFNHPTVNRSTIHKSYLVLNGHINDEVRERIVKLNDGNMALNRNLSYLDVIDLDSLINDFTQAQGDFLPIGLKDFYLFLELFLSDGTDFINKTKLVAFFDKVVFLPQKRKNAFINAISSSVILSGYILKPYQDKNNYFALFEAWTLLSSCIIHYATTSGLDKSDYNDTLALIHSEIIQNLERLKQELLIKDNFLEGNPIGDGDLVYRARATITLGALSALEVYHATTDNRHTTDTALLKRLEENLETLWFWGESAFPFFFYIIKMLEISNKWPAALHITSALLDAIIKMNSPDSEQGLASPYYTHQEILGNSLVTNSEPIDFHQFTSSSFTLKAIISILARRNARDVLEPNWYDLSHISMEDFIFERAEDLFLWRSKKGVNSSSYPKSPQSWRELLAEDKSITYNPLYLDNFQLLIFLVIVFPHRATNTAIGLLDKKLVI
jgi:hypothetical protein